jgi:hypothetical protein
MQKISFTTASAGTIEFDDVNISSLNGERIFRLCDFDGNSQKTKSEAVQCIGMPGQRTLLTLPAVKTIMVKLAFAPVYVRNTRIVCTGTAGMYALRREVLRHFPLGESGTLIYNNDVGIYTITARLEEVPVVAVQPGCFCECTLYLTADYPYWCRPMYSEVQTVVSGSPAIFEPPEYGDIESPVGGIITCTQSQLNDGEAGTLTNYENQYASRTKQIRFCRPLQAGETLTFSFLYNNEWSVLLNGSPASDFVYFEPGVTPCTSVPGKSTFRFTSGGGGSLDVQLIYRNLCIAI